MSDFLNKVRNNKLSQSSSDYSNEIKYIKRNILLISVYDNYYLYQESDDQEAIELYHVLLNNKDFKGFKIEKIDRYRYHKATDRYIHDVLIEFIW